MIPLQGQPGTLEFQMAYNTALAQARAKKRAADAAKGGARDDERGNRRLLPGARTLKISKNTRGMRRRILEKIRTVAGDKPIRDLTKGHIASVFLSPLPAFERNNWLKSFRGLMKFALEAELIEADPTAGITKSKAEAGTISHLVGRRDRELRGAARDWDECAAGIGAVAVHGTAAQRRR